MSGAYDAWAIHAALLRVKAGLFNVNLYIFQNVNGNLFPRQFSPF